MVKFRLYILFVVVVFSIFKSMWIKKNNMKKIFLEKVVGVGKIRMT